MTLITSTGQLAEFCQRAAQAPYVTVDTEFLRERTYYAQLCLVQMAIPGDDDGVAVDTLAEGLDLAPIYELFRNPDVVKVFHAARQDLEIFWVQGQTVPAPLFDSQVAAMVCGFGEQASYETLVRQIAKAKIDKSSRFTDWSRRPLSDKQIEYALADVTYLRQVYEHLSGQLTKSGRAHWVEEELAALSDPASYVVEPREAWRRVKTRTATPQFLAIVRELAEFRESEAQRRNVPRSRIIKDDALLEIASLRPKNHEALGKARLLLREGRKGDVADGLLAAIERGVSCPRADMPEPPEQRQRPPGSEALAELLRVLLRGQAEKARVAPKLIASAAEIDAIAAGERDLPVLHGWRREVFGEAALRLASGELALSARGNRIEIVELPPK